MIYFKTKDIFLNTHNKFINLNCHIKKKNKLIMHECNGYSTIENTVLLPSSSCLLDYLQSENLTLEHNNLGSDSKEEQSGFNSNFLLLNSAKIIFYCKDLFQKTQKLAYFDGAEEKTCKDKLVNNTREISKKCARKSLAYLKALSNRALIKLREFLISDFLVKYLTVAAFSAYVMTFVIVFGSSRVQRNVFVKNSHHRTLFAFVLSLISYLLVPTQNLPAVHLTGLKIDLKVLMYNLLINYLLQACLSC